MNTQGTSPSCQPTTISAPKPAQPFMYDVFEKYMAVYFVAFSKVPITYNGITTNPKPLYVSPDVFRGFTCPAMCGACCRRGTLDYLPSETRPTQATLRTLTVNSQNFDIYSDMQNDHSSMFCRHLNPADARCNIYEDRPMACDFPLLQCMEMRKAKVPHFQIHCKLFARSWHYTKITGQKDTACDMLPITPQSTADTQRRFRRVKDWMDYLQLDNWMNDVIAWANRSPTPTAPLKLGWP